MAITATFKADFSSFLQAIDKAELALVDMSKGASKVESSLNRMVDTFSGRKLIQEATLMTIAVEKAGGVAALTNRQLQEVGATANEAADKLKRLGYEVPAGLQKLADASAKTTTVTQGLHSSLGKFDGILGALGVNISSAIRALGEMSAAMGQSVSQLGLLATAGLAAGTALGAYELTRSLLNATGASQKLDKAVGDTAAALFGLGDITKEVAGAQQDVMNKAIRDGADATITYTDALKFNDEMNRKHTLTIDTSAGRIEEWRKQIGKLVNKGELSQLQEELQSGAFTLDELSKRYGISSGAIQLFVADQKAVADGMRVAEEATQAFDKALAESAKAAQEVEQKVRANVDFSIEQIGKRQKTELEYVRSSIEGTKQLEQIQADNNDFIMKSTLSATDYKIAKIHEWETATIKGFQGTQAQLEAYTIAVQQAAANQINALTQVNRVISEQERLLNQLAQDAITTFAVIGTGTPASLLRPDTQGGIQAGPVGGSATSPGFVMPGFSLPPFSLSGRAGGGPVSAGTPYMVGEHGPELFQPSTAGTILTAEQQRQIDAVMGIQLAETNKEIKRLGGTMIATVNAVGVREIERLKSAQAAPIANDRAPDIIQSSNTGSAMGASGGLVVNNTFNIVDTEANIARRVSDQITRTIKQATKWGAA
jgi:hypothetical protein